MGPTTRLMKLEHSFRPLATFFFELRMRATLERERERERRHHTTIAHIGDWSFDISQDIMDGPHNKTNEVRT
jgi:hypothetical protein